MIVGATQSEASGAQQAVMEANLSVEVAMIVLDTVTLYVNSFKVILLLPTFTSSVFEQCI